MSNLVKFAEYDEETAKQEQAEIDSSGGGADFMSLEEGSNVVRFLPPRAGGKKTPYHIVYQHYINVPGRVDSVKFACPKKMANEPCPACSKAEQLRSSGNPVDADTARKLWPRRRFYANVIDRSEPEKGPRILAGPKTMQEQLVGLRQDKAAGGDYTHPLKGFDIVIKRTGKGLNTEYAVHAARETTPLASDAKQMQEWIDGQHNLEALVRVPSQDEIMAMMLGTPTNGGGGKPPAERITSGARSKEPRARTVQDDVLDTTAEEVTDD